MKSLQHIQSAIRLDQREQASDIPQVLGHAAFFADKALGEYVTDGEPLAVFVLVDAGLTEAVSSYLRCRTNIYPNMDRYAVEDVRDFDRLVVSDINRNGRMPELLKAVRILRREFGRIIGQWASHSWVGRNDLLVLVGGQSELANSDCCIDMLHARHIFYATSDFESFFWNIFIQSPSKLNRGYG